MGRYLCEIRKIQKGIREIEKIQKGIVKLDFVESIVETTLPFISIYMIARVIDLVSKVQYEKAMYALTIGMLSLAILELIKTALDYHLKLAKQKFEMQYAMKLSEKFATLDFEKVEDVETHRLKSRIEEMRNLNNAGIPKLLECFSKVIHAMFEIIFSIALTWKLFMSPSHGSDIGEMYSFVLSPVFSVIMIIVILINTGISMKMGVTMTYRFSEIMKNVVPFNRVYNYYFEYISTYRAGKDIRIFSQKDLIKKQIDGLMLEVNGVFDQLTKNRMIYSAITTVASVFMTVLTYMFVALKALAGVFGIGSVVQYINTLNRFTDGFTSFMTEMAQLFANNEALDVYFAYQNIPSKLGSDKKDVPVREKMVEIEFRNVSFRYPGSEEYVLKNINVKFGLGDKIAIVGMNGSGKTTFIKLLCRLYEPTEGSIWLNGRNIQDYRLEEYFKLCSVVFQDFELLSFSLKENIAACRKADINEKKVIGCIQEVGLTEEGWNQDMVLFRDFDEKGVEISGGEAQKIALARALYKQGQILILDEPTAALDPIAEARLYENFSKIVKGRTAVFISHRLASCKFCDDILVFDEGRIVQRGTHQELLAAKTKRYYQLWSTQAQHYK